MMFTSTRIFRLFSADVFLITVGLIGLAGGSVACAQRGNVAVTSRGSSCTATGTQGLVALRAPAANPLLSLCDGHPLTSANVGSGTPLALASADFDEDGVPDLVSASAAGNGGSVTIYRGNIAALWPYGVAAQYGTPAAFLSNPRSFATPESPDFIATGDFDADGHLDIVVAKRGSTALCLLKGDGHGGFAAAKRVEVAGRITNLIAGEMNQPDGLSDLIVAMTASSGGAVAVYQSPLGALRGQPETFATKQVATSLALGKFSGSALRDLAVGAGNELVLIRGRDRKLSTTAAAGVPAAELSTQSLSFGVAALASGDFTGQRPSLAVLGDDGNIHIFEHSVSPTAAASLLGNSNAVPTMMVAGGRSDLTPAAFGSALVSGGQARASALRRATPTLSVEWTEQSVVSLPTATGATAHSLTAARISGSAQEDLVVIDSQGSAVHVLSTLASARQKKLSAATSGVATGSVPQMNLLGTLSASSSPVAALPMRLSQHGLSGLVTLQSNSSVPVVTPQDVAPTAVFTVTNTLDITDISQKDSPPAGSLRAAIENSQNAAAANGGVYSIVFNIPTSDPGYNAATGVYTIQPLSENVPNSLDYFALPPINYAVTIDGYTQPGASPNTLTAGDNAKIVIQIDGGKATTPGGAGLVPFDDSGTVIRGLAFTGWTNPNIASNGTASGAEGIEANGVGDFIEGNFFGTADGKTPSPNRIGIFADNGPLFGSGTGNIIGGTSPQARNIISANTIYGIAFLSTAYEAQLQGNFVGLDSSGATVMGNVQDGVGMNGSTITIGGTLAGARNYIAGNGYNNVDINDLTNNGAATGSYVQGNYIGTDASGTKVLSPTNFGVIIDHNPTNYLIGGTTPSARNLLSGNKVGVAIYDNAFYNLVQGNYIGTDVTGTFAVPNTTQGFLSGQQSGSTSVPAGYTTVGGTTAGAGNVISGNLLDGVLINGTSQSSPGYTPYIGSTVQGNSIGTDTTGTKALPNQGNGVSIALGGTNNSISAGNLIAYNALNGVLIDPGTSGGPGTGNVTIANVIASNGGAGVRVKTGSGNRISANSIFGNAALGIDLDAAGPGTNSHCNATSAGANLLQNYPVLTAGTGGTYITATATDPNGNTSEFSKAVAATQAANALNLLGSFDGLPSTTFTIEFFSNPSNDPSGYGQGKTYLGSTAITTDANCSGTIADPVDLTQADVSVILTKPTSGLQLGADFGLTAYTAVVANNGPATAHNVTFTDVLPAQLQLSGTYCNVGVCQSPIVTSQGICAVNGNSITCNLGAIATGASVNLSIPVQVLTAGSITNVANVTATETDPNLLNNVSSSTATASYPYPSIDHVDPAAALANGPALPMNIYGLGFTTDSTVTFNGTTLPVLGLIDNQTCGNTFQPSFCSALQVSVPASLLTSTGSVYVSVTNPGTYSGNATFNIASACTYSVFSLLDTSVENTGTNLIAQSVDVTTNVPSCSWTATSTVPWAVVLDEASAQGTGQVDVAFAPNTSASTRSGSITVAGQTFNFTQDAGSSSVCSVALSPSTIALDATGGSGTINASLSNSSCAPFVEAYPQSNWITITNNSNLLVASGPVTYKVAPNTGPARLGSITVGGNVTLINQEAPACYFVLSSSASIEAASGGTGSVTVTPTPSSCAWTATSSNPSQVTVTSGASGTGVGTVNYTVAKNTLGPTATSINIGNSIATSTFTINQASANTCTFAITPSPLSVTSSGLSSYFTVTASFSFCKWTAASNNPDSLDITGGVSGTGTGAVYYSVAQNSGAARTLTITAGCQTFTVNQSAANISSNPTPVLTSLQPSSTLAGSAAFTLTVNGSGFVSGAVINFNGTARATTFLSATQLTASVLAADVANTGTIPVTVTNPTPGGGTSNALTFTINAPGNPLPVLSSLLPSSANAGSAGFTLTVTGTGFVNGAVVNFNGTARATTFVSATQVTASIPATDVAAAGTVPITVTNPAPAGGTSNAVAFIINAIATNPTPTVTILQPSSVTAGAAAFTLDVTGTGFVSGAVVNFNGTAHTTTFVSATQITASILATDVAAAGTVPITVTNPAPGGGTSNAVTFTINAIATNPLPTVTLLQPSSVAAGSAAFPITVNGTGFAAGAIVNFNGVSRATTVISATQLTAAILASDVATAGNVPVTVTNPAPGGGTSNAISFAISSPSAASFALSSNTAPQTIFPGGSAQYSIMVTAVNGTYTNPIALSASGLPSGATALFAPASLTPGSTAVSSTLTIQTAQAVATAHRAPGISLLASALPLLTFLLAAKRKRLQRLLLIFFALIGSIGLVGCNGGISYFGDHPQTYNVTVTGTSGTTQQSTTIRITVNY
jgi:hypothetical protein